MSRVLVVDDHPVFRKGMVALLRASGYDVVAEAATGTEAVAAALREGPDVVLMDLAMPELGGLRATEQVVAALPGCRVLVVTLFDDDASVAAALRAGAAGYVVKQAPPDEILAAVAAVERGAQWLGSGVPRPGAQRADVPATSLPGGLTRREARVADLLAKGLSNPVIAQRLGISAKTVANNVSSVLLKLGASDRADAVRIVRERLDRG
ncbi:response regulator transcription factor [Angustibacter speluncae]